METTLIKTDAEWQAWVDARIRHDMDFEDYMPQLPVLMIWTDTESNGYPRVERTFYQAAQLQAVLDRMAVR